MCQDQVHKDSSVTGRQLLKSCLWSSLSRQRHYFLVLRSSQQHENLLVFVKLSIQVHFIKGAVKCYTWWEKEVWFPAHQPAFTCVFYLEAFEKIATLCPDLFPQSRWKHCNWCQAAVKCVTSHWQLIHINSPEPLPVGRVQLKFLWEHCQIPCSPKWPWSSFFMKICVVYRSVKQSCRCK